MSWIRRFVNVFRRRRIGDEIEAELASHIEKAIEQGRAAEEARRKFGSSLRHRERSRDIKLLPWLDALTSDVVFGWRHLRTDRGVSAAAILSLALAIGATTAASRLVDAVLLRPLPVVEPNRLFFLATTYIDRDGRPDIRDDFDYPTFRRYSAIVGDRADVMLVGMSARLEARFGSGADVEL